MATSEAQKRASQKWADKNAEKLSIKLNKNKGITKERIAIAAAREGMSVNAWVIECIKDKL